MNSAPVISGLRPTWRMRWQQIRVHHDAATNRRAERLVMRGIDRNWAAARIERLLERLEKRAAGHRATRNRHSLTRADGWGSAGQCPASHGAKTPAMQKRASHVVGVGQKPARTSTRATASRTVREGVL